LSELRDVICGFIEEAIWAPSGDNSQPWEFVLRDEELEVYCLPERDNKVLNFKSTGTYIASGALIENLDIIARSRGYGALIEYFPDDELPTLVARMRFQQSKATTEPLAEYIRQRHTNRKPYDSSSLSGKEEEQLIGAAQGPDSIVRLVEDSKMKHSIAAACSIMERIALETPTLHRLFFESLVWSREEEAQRGGGLYIKTLELPPPISALFRLVRHWPVTALMNYIGFSKVAAAGNAKVYASASAFGAVIINSSDRKSFVSAGRVFQRLWLQATRLNLCLQPVTGIVFLFQRLDAGELTMLSERQIAAVAEAKREFGEAYNLANDEFVAMHFRVGRAAIATIRSSRRAPQVRTGD
jgi:hypothetical protein